MGDLGVVSAMAALWDRPEKTVNAARLTAVPASGYDTRRKDPF